MTSLQYSAQDILSQFPQLQAIQKDVRESFYIPERTYYAVPPLPFWSERSLRMPELDMLPFQVRDELKKQLNILNHAKDEFNVDPEIKKSGDYVVRVFDFYNGLRNYMKNIKGAQITTNAWLKCYEMLEDYNLASTREPLRVFYNAELPGAFISATNHFCANHDIPYEWLASSYYPKEGHTMLGDRYGMYANNRDHWIMDADMNGDLTQPDILLSIKQRVLRKFPQGTDLYFSDAGMDVEGKFNAQEEVNSLLNYGQVLSGLMTLAINGNFVVKQYTFFKPLTLSIIALLRNMFVDFAIVKPKTSRPTNSEVYLVGRGFYGLLPSVEVRLLDIMRGLRDICEREGIYNPIDMGIRCAEFGFYRADERFYRDIIGISHDIFIKIQSNCIHTMLRCISDYKLHRFANATELANHPFVYYIQRMWHTRAMDEYLYTKRVQRLKGAKSFKLSWTANDKANDKANETVFVRLCNRNDIPAVQTVMMETFTNDFTYGYDKKYHKDYERAEFEKTYLETSGNFMYVATVGSDVVGMGGVRLEGYRSRNLDSAFTKKYYHSAKQPIAKIVRVFVKKPFRTRGIARMIVETILKRLRTEDTYKKCRIVLDSEYAVDFWHKMGAVEVLKQKNKDYTTTYFEFPSRIQALEAKSSVDSVNSVSSGESSAKSSAKSSEAESEAKSAESKESAGLTTYPTYTREELAQRIQRDGKESTVEAIRNEFRDKKVPFPYGSFFIRDSDIQEKAQRLREFKGVWAHKPYSIRADEYDPQETPHPTVP